ncbi:MAG: glycine zipper family protein, partial [Rhodopila sp.]
MKEIAVFLVTLGMLGGCSDMSATQQRALTGTVGGSATGAVIGAIAGNAGLGAAIGAGAGFGGGLVYDKVKKDEQAAYQQGYAAGHSSGATDKVLGLTRRLAACFKDSRNQAFTEHTVETLVMQRVA